MDPFRLAFLLLPLLASAQSVNGVVVNRCEPITIPLCMDVRYNETIKPTLLGHNTQEEAARDLQQFYPFLKGKCSSDLKFLLCYLYAPVCTILETAVPPCKAVCDRAKKSCETLMHESGFAWPESMRCEKFPEVGICVRRPESPTTAPPVTTAAPAETHTRAPDRSGPPGAKPEIEETPPNLHETDVV